MKLDITLQPEQEAALQKMNEISNLGAELPSIEEFVGSLVEGYLESLLVTEKQQELDAIVEKLTVEDLAALKAIQAAKA